MDMWMLSCLVFVFCCILATVTAIILVTWNKEKREKKEKEEKAVRYDESSDAIERKIFDLNGILETPEIKQRNIWNMRNPACFSAGPFYLCIKTSASPASESEPSKVLVVVWSEL
jgi:hypothetical protein